MFYAHIRKSVIIQHVNGLKDIIESRIRKKIEEVKKRPSDKHYIEELTLLSALLDIDSIIYYERILDSKPNQLLETIYETIKRDFNININGSPLFLDDGIRNPSGSDSNSLIEHMINHDIVDIFDYLDFCRKEPTTRWNAYALALALKIRTCTYCNSQYTLTITEEMSNGKMKYIMRPEFDHYYEKSKYPFFALSIYNLIPCCHYCNSVIKGKKSITPEKYLHPYIDERENGLEYFDFYYGFSDIDNTTIKTVFNGSKSEKVKNTFDFFKIGLVYTQHTATTDAMIRLAREYSPSYIEDLVKNYNGKLHLTKQSIIRMVFSSYDIKNTEDEVLGKLRKDILERIYKDIYEI